MKRTIVNGHRLKVPEDCNCNKEPGNGCIVCDQGLSVCLDCGKGEIELEQPCKKGGSIEKMKERFMRACRNSFLEADRTTILQALIMEFEQETSDKEILELIQRLTKSALEQFTFEEKYEKTFYFLAVRFSVQDMEDYISYLESPLSKKMGKCCFELTVALTPCIQVFVQKVREALENKLRELD